MNAINIADIVNPSDPQKRTFREINNAASHLIPIGTLVEVDCSTSEYHLMRGYIVQHVRDCDGTPLYTVGPKGYEDLLAKHLRVRDYPDTEEGTLSRYLHHLEQQKCWSGFDDESLIVIKPADA